MKSFHEFALPAPLTWLTPPFPQGSPRVPRTDKKHSRAPWHQNSTSRRKAALARLDLLAPDLVFRGYSAGVSAFLSCALPAPGLRRSLPWPVCSPSFAAIASRLLTRLRLGVAPVSVFFRGRGLVNGGDRWNSREDNDSVLSGSSAGEFDS